MCEFDKNTLVSIKAANIVSDCWSAGRNASAGSGSDYLELINRKWAEHNPHFSSAACN